ncbi:putative lipid II flippase FtsW [Candidatus Poribacteria bacterium]|nr:MAG: putative lipid II flippase FtsW [Candidatus Poribacteria bacterium]
MENYNTLNYTNPTVFSADRKHPQITGLGRVDTALLVVTLGLVGIGILMVYSAGHVLSEKQYDTSYHYLKIQAIACVIGLVGMGIASYIPYRFYEKYSNVLLFLAFGLLILVFTPLGTGVQGSEGGRFNRWIAVAGVQFQPVEFAKIALIIHTAHFLSRNPERIKSLFNGVLPNILIIGLMFGLVAIQPDFGSAVLLAATAGSLLFIGGIRLLHTFMLIGVGGVLLAGFIKSDPYRLTRLTDYWAALQSPEATSYQLGRSFDALQWGGLFGVGIDGSVAKINYLPYPHTDFIFSILGEEFGFIGTTVIIIIFMIFIWRGISIARRTENRFGGLLATGFTIIIGLQAFINIGVVTGLLPTKGITLPFLSYGGSSLVISLVIVGMLLNISRSAIRSSPKTVE